MQDSDDMTSNRGLVREEYLVVIMDSFFVCFFFFICYDNGL